MSTKQEELKKIMILEARLCLYGWATIGRGLPAESFKKVLKSAIPEWDESEDLKLSYPDGMTAQDCHFQVHAALNHLGFNTEEHEGFVSYLRKCFKQDGNWWLFGMFPTPRLGRSDYVKQRERVEEEVGLILWGKRPIEKFNESAA